MIRVFKDTKQRANEFALYTSADGTRYPQVPRDLLEWADTATPPVDYSEDTYSTQEIMDAPYVIFTKKSDEQIAQVRWSKLSAIRDNLMLTGGAKVGDKWYHSDTHSKVQQLALMIAGANLPAGIQWKTMDGSFIEMTPTLALQIYSAQMAQEQAIFQVAETKKTDTSDLNAGWPDTYVEVVE